MFTGIIEAIGTIAAVRTIPAGKRFAVEGSTLFDGLALGESVAINGCCLTVVLVSGSTAEFEAGPETLRKTNLGELDRADHVNLERALKADGRLGGHLVQGHVDGIGTIRQRQRHEDWETVWLDAGELAAQLVPKGSVAVDGISLTVVDVAEPIFSVALIPHTLERTTLGAKRVGATVNLETDVIGKYVLKYLQQLSSGLSLDGLRRAGFAP
jgi:riboflavin synthase